METSNDREQMEIAPKTLNDKSMADLKKIFRQTSPSATDYTLFEMIERAVQSNSTFRHEARSKNEVVTKATSLESPARSCLQRHQ